jgi:hypothetical protein
MYLQFLTMHLDVKLDEVVYTVTISLVHVDSSKDDRPSEILARTEFLPLDGTKTYAYVNIDTSLDRETFPFRSEVRTMLRSVSQACYRDTSVIMR